MMKLFKKKKSDKNISNTILQQQDSKAFDSPNIKKQPKPAVSTTAAPSTLVATDARSSSPPAIVMPKPRRLVTPTRAILGRFDHDKTQVEEEEPSQFVHQQEISPILLPTPQEEPLLPQLVKPVARHLKQPLQQQQQQQQALSAEAEVALAPVPAPAAYSRSTVQSDDSSRVYESALESLSDTTDDDHVADLPDLPMLKKQPSYKPIVNPYFHAPPQQAQQQAQQPQQQHHQMYQELQQDIIATSILSDSFSRTMSPQHYTQKRPNTGPSSGSSAVTVTPLQHRNSKQTLTPSIAPITANYESQQPQKQYVPPPQPPQSLVVDHQSQQQQKNEQEFLLRELKKQVELIEKQRIKDREEWTRKEQELITNSQQMMETLIETKDQLTNVLKTREEENNKAKLSYYDKQLKKQQLLQLQKQVVEMGLSQQQQNSEQEESSDDNYGYLDEPIATQANINYYPQQKQYYYENDQNVALEENVADEDELQLCYQKRLRNRTRSEEYIRHDTRSSSRSSYHYQQHIDDGGRRSSSTYHMNNDETPISNRKSVSRRASSASNKSGGGHRFDHASPATTLGSTHTVSKRRPRAQSIESTRWMMKMNVAAPSAAISMAPSYIDDMMVVPYEKLRKSRSVGRDLHSMRPISRSSSAYNAYYDDGDVMEDDLFDSQLSFYDSGYYSNYIDNIPPNKQQQQQQQMMSRYNSDIPYYSMQQQQPQQQQSLPPPRQQQYVYSPVDYYYQQPARHNQQRYNARHHYSYN